MVKKSTSFKNLYKNTPLEKYKRYFYYGFGDWCKDEQIGYFLDGIWPNEESIKSLNRFQKYYADKKLDFIFVDKNKPDICMMFLKQPKVSKVAIVAAGGGLGSVASGVESIPIGDKLYRLGFSVAIINYSICEDAKFDNSYEDLLSSIRYLQTHQKELNINMDKFIIGGCSAGGYVVARYGTENVGYMKQNLPKPGLMFLAYPVITMGKFTHLGTRDFLLGKNPSQELIDRFSIEKHISKDFPPTFVWQCLRDNQVPIQNTKFLVDELKRNKVPVVYRTYDSDIHGWGIGTKTMARYWISQMLSFYKKINQ